MIKKKHVGFDQPYAKIVVTSEYEPEEMANMRKRFPQLEITHAFEPLFDLIQ